MSPLQLQGILEEHLIVLLDIREFCKRYKDVGIDDLLNSIVLAKDFTSGRKTTTLHVEIFIKNFIEKREARPWCKYCSGTGIVVAENKKYNTKEFICNDCISYCDRSDLKRWNDARKSKGWRRLY